MAQGFEERFSASYGDILRLARARLAREHAPVSTVTLAHELYLNLRDRADLQFSSSGAFLAYASRAMRSLLLGPSSMDCQHSDRCHYPKLSQSPTCWV